MRVIVGGASGFIGRHLTRALLARGDEVIALTRDIDRTRSRLPAGVRIQAWNPPSMGQADEAFNQADAVVNLAGEPVADRPWTEERKKKILDSRVDSTRAIVKAIERADHKPRVFVNQSAIGYYGDRGDATLTEESGPGNDFLAELVESWEAAARPVESMGVRPVLLRTGIVLGSDGGVLPRLAIPFKLFLGGTMGRPEQWVSWIHIDDEIGIMIFALTNEDVQGPVNACAPNPVRMEQFSREVGAALSRPSWVPFLRVPMKVVLGKRAEAVLASQRVVPVAADNLGFAFRHSTSADALQSLFGPRA